VKAVQVRAYGGPEVLALGEVPAPPPPGPGELLIAVRAAGVNPVDVYLHSGQYTRKIALPYVPGSDAAGIVEAAGPGSPFSPGDRVYVNATAVYAEKALVPASRAWRLPGTLSFEQGAAIGVPYATAHRALFHCGGAAKGETVLIHGASGGVGVAAVQLALAAGLDVIGTAGGPEGVAFLKSLGVTRALDHRAADYLNGVQPNLILEMLADKNLGTDLAIAAFRGRIVIIGSRGAASVEPRLTMTKDLTVRGMSLFNVSEPERAEIHASLAKGFASEALKPLVGKKFPLAEASKAHEAVMEPGARGKIVRLP
jgi:NADPH2:quinone reductase